MPSRRGWARLRLLVLQRDGYVCAIRGPKCTYRATDVDHILTFEVTGDDPAFLRAACHPCNLWVKGRVRNPAPSPLTRW